MPAEFSQRESRATAEIPRHLKAAKHRQISPRARPADRVHPQHVARAHLDRRPARQADAIEVGLKIRAAKRDDRGRVEAQRRAGHYDFERGGGLGIAEQTVREAVREMIHRPRRRHADGPESDAARIILHRRLRAGFEHIDRIWRIREIAEEPRGHGTRAELRRGDDLAQVVEIALDPAERRARERRLQTLNRGLSVWRVDDDFREHRIVERRDFRAGLHPRLAARAFMKGDLGERAATRLEILVRVFRVDADLDGMAARCMRVRVEKSGVARGEADHPLDKINARDLLGHAMLDLQARVHFEEIERAAVRIEDELDGACRAIADGLAELHRRREKRGALLLRQSRRGRLLDDLLIAPLRRAVALAEREDAALSITENLHLDMPRMGHELFEKDARVLEIAPAQPLDGREGVGEFRAIPAHAHPDAAAARRALQHHRIADALHLDRRRIRARDEARARQQRHAVLLRDGARGVLQAEDAHLLRRRPDERETRLLAGFREVRVLAEEAVARMNRLRAGAPRGVENLFHEQVAFADRRRPEQNRLIGLAHMDRIRVRLRIHRDRADTEPVQRAGDAA